MAVQGVAGTGLALGTAGEEEVAAEVGAEEVEVAEQEQAAGTPQGLHLERGGPSAGWETFPSVPASARWGKQNGSWEPAQEVVMEEKEGEEMLLRLSVEQEEPVVGE